MDADKIDGAFDDSGENEDKMKTKDGDMENQNIQDSIDGKMSVRAKDDSKNLLNEKENVNTDQSEHDEDEHRHGENDFQENPDDEILANEEARDEFPTETKPPGKDSKENVDFNQIVYGFQPRGYYEHNKMLTDLVDVTFNPRTREFIFLDTRGICTWNKDGLDNTVSRPMSFPKYQNRLLRKVVYARKYNVYFCLGKDFSLRVLNRNFDETCSVSSGLSSVMFLLFNPVRDELITGGVKGTKIWEFRQVADRVWKEIKPMANYALFLKKELTDVGGSWVKKVELDQHLQHLYCCSETSVHCYDMEGKLLFKLEKAHRMTITGCRYSLKARLLVTSSADAEVKVWSLTGGLVTTFRGHAKPITNLLLHPESSALVLTCSLDGTVRLWSLDIMECLYVIQVATEGVEWMGLTGERLLWTSTRRNLNVWSLNTLTTFWALARCKTKQLKVVHGENKTSRVMAVGDDSSIRFLSKKERKNLSTVLPPPPISPLEQLLSVTYSREHNSVYVLINHYEIWVYTTKTDPATRTAVWNLFKLQQVFQQKHKKAEDESESSAAPVLRPSSGKGGGIFGHGPTQTHRATASGSGFEAIAECYVLCTLNCPTMYWTDEGYVCPDNTQFLLLGMQDGRILFMDPVTSGLRHFVLQANKDAILDIRYNEEDSILISQCHPREDTLFQCWDLPSLELLYEVTTPTTITDFAVIGNIFLCGHSTGSVQIHELKRIDPSSHGRSGHRSSISDISDISSDQGSAIDETGSIGGKKREHFAPVICAKACHNLEIFMTCSSDGMIKVWDTYKTLQTEIILDESLTTAAFLNKTGDVLVGFKNHIFFIDHTKVNPSQTGTADVHEDEFEVESDIYEDPAVRYEGAAANPDPIDMKNYLVPFELDFSADFLDNVSPSSTHTSEEEDDESDSDLSMAPTDIYLSPIGSPRRLSRVDLLMSPDFTAKDIMKKAAMYHKRNKSSKLLFQSPDSGLEFEMPVFGESPGVSPAPTPPSSVSDAELSQEESEEEEEEEEEVEITFEPIEKPEETTPAITIEIPEVKTPDSQTSKKSRFDLSSYKIDAKALMKDAQKRPKSSTEAPPKQEPEVPAEDITTKKPAVPARVIQKKQMKRERMRVTGGKVRTPDPGEGERVESRQEIKQPEETEEIQRPQSSVESTPEPGQKGSPFMVSKKQTVKTENTAPLQSKQPISKSGTVVAKTTIQQNKMSASSTVITLKPSGSAEVSRSGMKPSKVLKKTKKTSTVDSSKTSKPMVSVSPTAGIDEDKQQTETDTETGDNEGQDKVAEVESQVEEAKETKDDKNSFTYGTDVATDIGQGERLQADKRPHTAHVTFQDQKELGDELIRKYRSCPTTPSDWHSKESWFEDYQEKLIKRNQMLKAQRQQRVESAHQKRRLLELRQRERRRALLGHDTCGEGYHSDTTGVDRDLMTKSDSSLNTLRRRAQSAGFMNAPTSVSTTLNRPQSAFAKFKEDEDLAANLPFRVRLNKQPTRIKVNESEVFEHLPGNGKQLILKKPPPSKSVPSKCRRYVLVSHTPAAPPIPKPTALEEHLLPNRFPRDLKRWNEFEDYVKSRVSEDPHMMFSGVDDFMSSAWK